MSGQEEVPAEAADPDWLSELAELADPELLDAFWRARPELHERETLVRLTRKIARLARTDPARAEKLGEAARRLAKIVGDDYGHALELKARGHLRFLVGDYEPALELYRACQQRFSAADAEIEAAVNLGSSMWMLALLGRYEEAWEDSRRSRTILEEHGDPVLLARVATNEANVFLRQDRHGEALERYRNALALFRTGGEVQDIAVTLHNIAVSSIAISDFEGALDSYHELTFHCRENDLALLAAQADYNIAYLYFFRGEYSRAIKVYQETRKQCELLGDDYHRALCDLDQAEMYLELNMSEEAGRLARLAFDAFESRGNGYEAAKALTFLAIAANLGGDRVEALRAFRLARDRFDVEGNAAWVAMTDFYRALTHHQLLNAREAAEWCLAARRFFDSTSWTSRVALCDLLLAQIELQRGDPQSARQVCRRALDALEGLELPALSLKAYVALGRVEEALNDRDSALQAYRRAHVLLEDLRTHLGSEESKIAFLSDKLEVYESLVEMTLSDSRSPRSLELAFGYIEQAKSRILADLMISSGAELRSSASDNPELVEKMRLLRAELSQSHHELDQLFGRRASAGRQHEDSESAPTSPDAGATRDNRSVDGRIEDLKLRSRRCEQRLLDTLRELRSRDSKLAAVHSAEVVPLASIRSAIPPDAMLVEYFESRGVTYVCVLGEGCFEIQALGETHRLKSTLELFAMQMSKSQLGEEYLRRFGEKTERSANTCLRELYRALIQPVESLLDCEHLVVVPHGLLHQVPFHALSTGAIETGGASGGSHLLDRFDVSYAPSASLFSALQNSTARPYRRSLVLGVPDARAPEILEEVEAVARILPESRLFVGDEASVEVLRSLAPQSRVLHIATHGFFRKDSPMFSAIQLGGSRLTLLDLYGLDIGAELVVLSGCSTGLHRVEAGDELMGLTRGLLYAGAQSLVTSLWDVHDHSTASFMKSFYGHLQTGPNRARALGRAVKEVRAEFPNPYHWAPFVLIGRYLEAASDS